jgi:hypothetical protein
LEKTKEKINEKKEKIGKLKKKVIKKKENKGKKSYKKRGKRVWGNSDSPIPFRICCNITPAYI